MFKHLYSVLVCVHAHDGSVFFFVFPFSFLGYKNILYSKLLFFPLLCNVTKKCHLAVKRKTKI